MAVHQERQLINTISDSVSEIYWIVGGLSTLVLHRGACAGVLQELQQKRLHDVGAAVESRQDVQQPPSSLTTLPAQKKYKHRFRAGPGLIVLILHCEKC